MTNVTRLPWLRGLTTVLALTATPMAALAEQAQRMAVLGAQPIVLGAGQTGADAPAYCVDLARDTPSTIQDLTGYIGDVTVDIRKNSCEPTTHR